MVQAAWPLLGLAAAAIAVALARAATAAAAAAAPLAAAAAAAAVAAADRARSLHEASHRPAFAVPSLRSVPPLPARTLFTFYF